MYTPMSNSSGFTGEYFVVGFLFCVSVYFVILGFSWAFS